MTNSAPPELKHPRKLIPSVAPVYNRTLSLPLTALIVSQSTPTRVSYRPSFPMTLKLHDQNSSKNEKFTYLRYDEWLWQLQSDQILISNNIHSFELCQFIEIITSRAVDNNTALYISTDATETSLR